MDSKHNQGFKKSFNSGQGQRQWNSHRKNNHHNHHHNHQGYDKNRDKQEHNNWKRNSHGFNKHNSNHNQQFEKKIDCFNELTLDDIHRSLNNSKHSWYDIGRIKILPKSSVGQFKPSGFI